MVQRMVPVFTAVSLVITADSFCFCGKSPWQRMVSVFAATLHTFLYSLLCLWSSLQLRHTSLSTVGSCTFSVFSPSVWNDLPRPVPQNRLSGFLQIKLQDISSSKTIDLPCFLLLAALFPCHKSLFVICLIWLWIIFCIVNILLCAGACVYICACMHWQ